MRSIQGDIFAKEARSETLACRDTAGCNMLDDPFVAIFAAKAQNHGTVQVSGLKLTTHSDSECSEMPQMTDPGQRHDFQ